MKRYRELWLTAALAAIVFSVDQGSKAWALAAFDLESLAPGERLAVLPLLNLTYTLNTGFNFGIGASDSASQQVALAALALAVSIVLAVWAARGSRRALSIGCGLVIGGALANALDRLLVGGVVDFVNVDCCGIGNPYAFNIADVAIFIGALWLALFGWSDQTREQAESRS